MVVVNCYWVLECGYIGVDYVLLVGLGGCVNRARL